jgi:hypothetical protein
VEDVLDVAGVLPNPLWLDSQHRSAQVPHDGLHAVSCAETLGESLKLVHRLRTGQGIYVTAARKQSLE